MVVQRIKVITCGNQETGKSCLIKRYCEKRFVSKYLTTIGIDYGITKAKLHNMDVKVNIFDMGGNPIFSEIRNEFYKDTQGILLVYDVSSVRSFHNLSNWMQEISDDFPNQEAIAKLVVVVIGNKTDLTSRRQVSEQEGQAYASKNGFYFFETSAQSGHQVQDAFETLFGNIILSLQGKRQPLKPQQNISSNQQNGHDDPISPTKEHRATPEQISCIKRISLAKDNWSKMGLSKSATKDDVNKAYKKLSLLLHPDKCQAPGSEDAFKEVLAAREALLTIFD